MMRIIGDRREFSRRGLILSLGGLAAAAPWGAAPLLAQPVFSGDPFQLGVAAGDPAADGFVIWTRLAPAPMEIGHGMPAATVAVKWEVAADEGFKTLVRTGDAFARPELGHAVHVELAGLEAGRHYWYRFIVGAERSPAGRAKTLPPPNAAVRHARFAVAGCQHYESGYFTGHRKMAEEDLDFVYCYGDYIYEYSHDLAPRTSGGTPYVLPRRHAAAGLTYSLDDYRRRYAEYKMDPDLQASHAATAWFSTWDDHEIENNWTSYDDRNHTPPEIFALRRAAAAQAFYEHTPLRASAFPVAGAMQIYRRAAFGQLMDLNFLDTRQYRSEQPCDDKWAGCTAVNSANSEVIGKAQEMWLTRSLSRSKARWNVLAQQIMMMDLDRNPGTGQQLNTDSWAGYRTPRNRLLSFVQKRKVNNLIVVTGDEHLNYFGELHLDGKNPKPRPVGVEFVGTSLSASGDGADVGRNQVAVMANNPTLKFMNAQRGYLVCDVTPERWQTEARVLDKVTTRDGVLTTRIKVAVAAGDPRIVAA